MPLLDHFHPPLLDEPPWETVHGAWIHYLMRSLNRMWLPPEYRAVTERNFGRTLTVDVGVVHEPEATYSAAEAGQPAPGPYEVPPADASLPNIRAPHVRILVYREDGGRRLVGAIELVSPGNKDRPEERRGFAAKLQTYLQSGVSVVLADVVTRPVGNLHNEWTEMFQGPQAARLPEPAEGGAYATAYRPYEDEDGPKVHVWLRHLAAGQQLPTLPLFLAPDLAVPVELEATYVDACADIRIGEPAAV
jgi:uncharacterized protein DUF4058